MGPIKTISLLFFLLLHLTWGYSQNMVQGKVSEKSGEPLFGVSVGCNGSENAGAATDFSGIFKLELPATCDTLCFAYIGFRRICMAVSDLRNTNFEVVLMDQTRLLNEVFIRANDPISDKFSVVKLEKLQIYLNPVAAGDPLKAITALPASTNADETADPALRGSASDRSRVVLNGVPIRSPVRNGQVNGLGNFSLFNTEMIQKLYVYASNPPLTFGNSSAGLVEVETNKDLDASQLQVSAGLASVGAFLSKKFKNDNFLQVYSNYQFADGFLGLNKVNLPQLIDFGTKDAGFNLKIKTGKRSYLNSFSYGIDESYAAQNNLFSYNGVINAGKTRFFSINNWNIIFEKGLLRFSSLIDESKQKFTFGNLKSDLDNHTRYYSIDYRLFLPKGLNVQFGTNYNGWKYNLNNRLSEYYYAIAPNAPSYQQDTALITHNWENYAYASYDVHSKWNISAGLRSNIPVFDNDVFYLSRQLSIKYEPNANNRILLSGGRYYNYSTPSFIDPSIYLLNSDQLALDYNLNLKNFQLSSAVFYKKESGNYLESDFFRFDEVKTFGVELMLKKQLFRYFEMTVSNTFLDQNIGAGDLKYRSASDFNYFTKFILQYENASVVTAGLTYITRPGKYFTPIVGSGFRQEVSAYEPVFDNSLNTAQYNTYQNLSFSSSRYFPMGRNSLVAFLSVTNILNRKNQGSDRYNSDYSVRSFDYYQLRTIYFGCVVMFGLR